MSELYQSISGSRKHTTDYIKERWEKEMKARISDEQWTNICKIQHSTTNCNTWREFSWKNITRFFIRPKLKAMQLGVTQSRWRNGEENEARHYHLFWSCPEIQQFWKDVWGKIREILKLKIPNSFLVLYLEDFPDEVKGSDKYLLKIFKGYSTLMATS